MEEKRVVIFVHGLWMNGLELALLRARVRRAGFATRQFRYSTVHDGLERNTDALFRFARALAARELHFVGYSLGGVVTLNMLARFHAQLPPGRVVLIGAPVQGSVAARGMAMHAWGRRMLGASQCLTEVHAGCWQGERELGVIAGTRGVGLGKLFGALPEPNDGTVALDETRLVNANAAVEFPHTHATLMFSRRVARAVSAFLRDGAFSQ